MDSHDDDDDHVRYMLHDAVTPVYMMQSLRCTRQCDRGVHDSYTIV